MSPKSSYLPSYQPYAAAASTVQRPDLPGSNETLTNTAVVIIGGGISGMCIAVDLLMKHKVKNFVILEQSGGFGGTWSVLLSCTDCSYNDRHQARQQIPWLLL